MTNVNNFNLRREFPQEFEGDDFSGATWMSLAFIVALYAGVAFRAFQSGGGESSRRPTIVLASSARCRRRPVARRSVKPGRAGDQGQHQISTESID